MTKIIDCVTIASNIKQEIKKEVETLNIKPKLAIVLVGDDSASLVYSKAKEKAILSVGMESVLYTLPTESSESDVVELIKTLNSDKYINAILVEMPLPKHINANTISDTISREKDVDCINSYNRGLLFTGNSFVLPATAYASIEIIKSVRKKISGLNAVIVGRSNIVGKPLAQLLLNESATITICHSKTRDLKNICKSADILCIAIGVSNFIDNSYIKENAIVIDIGINVLNDGSITGDVLLKDITNASFISPVPKGVGVVTTAMILKNTLMLYKNSQK